MTDTGESRLFLIPEPVADMEGKVPDCFLKPVKVADYPMDEDYGEAINDIEALFGGDLAEYFMEKFGAEQEQKLLVIRALPSLPITRPQLRQNKEVLFSIIQR